MEAKTFPIETQIGTFKNEYDLELWMHDKWIHNSKVVEFTPYDYGLIKHSSFIYTEGVVDVLNRYAMFKHGIISFSNNYDEMPIKWIETLILIDNELPKAMEAKKRIDGKK